VVGIGRGPLIGRALFHRFDLSFSGHLREMVRYQVSRFPLFLRSTGDDDDASRFSTYSVVLLYAQLPFRPPVSRLRIRSDLGKYKVIFVKNFVPTVLYG
jgi:hypothetical protein